ncbi:hypothetical protein QFC24_006812 [Naganishia onofrii]|uniref:Uncharacterized protein n=1 Tax=Naganishia onofrii TaxID=1851511 RepID=A0ACC2WYK8_9TREE|nr:hypothetical protein QFC24_006812 [Naganishia onofrii]
MNTDAAAGVTCRRPSHEANTQTLNPIVQQITTSRSSQETHNETYDKPYRVSSHPSTKSHSESLPGDTDTNHAPGGGGGPTQEVEEGEGAGSISFTEKEDRTVAMKIDRVLLPLLMSAYCLQYIDKSAMSYAAVFHFRQDNHLSAKQYQWLGSCYYLGYLFFEFPGSRALCFYSRGFIKEKNNRSSEFVKVHYADEGQLTWLVDRVGLFYCCNGLGSGIGALISYGTGHITSTSPTVQNYHWIFIIDGILTLICGAAFLLLCPDQAESAWFLSSRERAVGKERLRTNQSSLASRRWKWEQLGEAFAVWKDPQGVLRIGNFYHLILQSYGFSAFNTILLGLPAAAIQIFFPLSASWVARRYKNARLWVMVSVHIRPQQFCKDSN